MAIESIAAISPTSSELIRNQRTVSALKSSDERDFKFVRARIREASSRGDTPGAAVASTKASRGLSGRRTRAALEKLVYSSRRGGYRGRASAPPRTTTP